MSRCIELDCFLIQLKYNNYLYPFHDLKFSIKALISSHVTITLIVFGTSTNNHNIVQSYQNSQNHLAPNLQSHMMMPSDMSVYQPNQTVSIQVKHRYTYTYLCI